MNNEPIRHLTSFRVSRRSQLYRPPVSSVSQRESSSSGETLRVEIFPILPAVVPALTAYALEVRGSELAIVGARFAIRCADLFPGAFLWTAHRLITDRPPGEPALQQ